MNENDAGNSSDGTSQEPLQDPLDTAKGDIRADKVTPLSETSEVKQETRSDLIATAVRFLENPRVQSSPLAQRKAFLLKKGLTNEDIDCAIEQARIVETPTVDYQSATVPTAVPPPVPPRLLPDAHYVNPEHTAWNFLRDVASVAAVLGVACYGAYYLYKRFLEPYLSMKGLIQKDDKLAQVQREVIALTAAVQQLREAVKSLEASVGNEQRMLRETESVDAVKHDAALSDLKSEVQSIKGLLLSRKQFPSTPKITPSIPTWQLSPEDSSKSNGLRNSEERLDGSGDHVNSGTDGEAEPEDIVSVDNASLKSELFKKIPVGK